ncbi:hypothetical protein CP97_03390 [Aurantiacibacter atlanticus]|uniref:Uncharacterized protein n=1 Tax=Aurantiacibacter atlanticus TaxID=1648404 RepID=A0A0H4VDX4_9SPHN|nr:hypothetical protein CP97_03390 [Aurantiacibacter atlanticus]
MDVHFPDPGVNQPLHLLPQGSGQFPGKTLIDHIRAIGSPRKTGKRARRLAATIA